MKSNSLIIYVFILFSFLFLFTACPKAGSNENILNDTRFKKYWFSGKAEITRYALEQARYGEIHKGDAVLIFVTEDFLKDKQVKYEFGDRSNALPILKLNFTKKFYTGIYPYSIMSSVFTPVHEYIPTLKITSTSQEWCGNIFIQFNRRNNKIHIQLRSYFQAEGDKNFKLKEALLEDEIWTKLRLNPNTLPTGKIKIIPSVQYTRLRHIPLKIEKANATMETTKDAVQQYTVVYKDLKRTLRIKFGNKFPYRIVGWEETYESGFGKKTKILTTRAIATKTILSDYWKRNKLSDSYLRDQLKLRY